MASPPEKEECSFINWTKSLNEFLPDNPSVTDQILHGVIDSLFNYYASLVYTVYRELINSLQNIETLHNSYHYYMYQMMALRNKLMSRMTFAVASKLQVIAALSEQYCLESDLAFMRATAYTIRQIRPPMDRQSSVEFTPIAPFTRKTWIYMLMSQNGEVPSLADDGKLPYISKESFVVYYRGSIQFLIKQIGEC